MDLENENAAESRQVRRDLARRVFAAFLLTFTSARVFVFSIMSHRVPDFYLYLGGTHIHHLNYGIILLSAVGAYLLFRRPAGGMLRVAAVLYGIGMALTFDEFGMWLHLGGGYWQRASWDAVTVLAAIFGLLAFAPSIRRFRPHHWLTAVVLLLLLVIFILMLVESLHYAGKIVQPKLLKMETKSP
jgi:hypothetical protein